MAVVNAHTMGLHRILDFIDDALASGLDTKDSLNLHDVVGGRVAGINTRSRHYPAETVAFDE